MARPITGARVAVCAAIRLYLDSEEDQVANEDTARLGPLLLRVLQTEGASDGDSCALDTDATLVDILALLQVLTQTLGSVFNSRFVCECLWPKIVCDV